MRMSAPGNEVRPAPRGARGFTLIEIIVVVAIVAVSTALVGLALRDGDATRLERDGQRLAALLEGVRAESRAAGIPVAWVPSDDPAAPGFRFVGLPPSIKLPEAWLNEGVSAQIVGGTRIVLGPEPIIGAHRILLRLEQQRLELVTDGLGPFAPATADAATP